MFIRLQPALLVFVSMIVGFFAAFYIHAPLLPEQAEQSALSFDASQDRLQDMSQSSSAVSLAYRAMEDRAANGSGASLSEMDAILTEWIAQARSESAEMAEQKKLVDTMLAISAAHTAQTDDVLDKVLSGILGDPIGQTFGKRAIIKVFSLKEAGYRGYMAKVKLLDPGAIKLVLSHDKVGDKGETTSQAAKRTGAKLAVNGGGFAAQDGLLYPMGITVVDGEIKTFYQTDLSFIGFNKDGKLVGGAVTSKEQIAKLQVMQGATFVPTLLKDGKKQTIPSKWKNARQPRTLIGHFSNGDLLFIVIDGRQKGYSNGVTLEEAQDKLLEFKVRDAYTLDGGGSSTFYYNGKVLNSPSDGRERLLATSFAVFP